MINVVRCIKFLIVLVILSPFIAIVFHLSLSAAKYVKADYEYAKTDAVKEFEYYLENRVIKELAYDSQPDFLQIDSLNSTDALKQYSFDFCSEEQNMTKYRVTTAYRPFDYFIYVRERGLCSGGFE